MAPEQDGSGIDLDQRCKAALTVTRYIGAASSDRGAGTARAKGAHAQNADRVRAGALFSLLADQRPDQAKQRLVFRATSSMRKKLADAYPGGGSSR
jgi:hypothetical protein